MRTLDYKEIELRILAQMKKEFNSDVHVQTAHELFGISIEEITPDMRRRAKAINYQLIYGGLK